MPNTCGAPRLRYDMRVATGLEVSLLSRQKIRSQESASRVGGSGGDRGGRRVAQLPSAPYGQTCIRHWPKIQGYGKGAYCACVVDETIDDQTSKAPMRRRRLQYFPMGKFSTINPITAATSNTKRLKPVYFRLEGDN